MAVNIFETCTNPISGESFRTISSNENAFVMQWAVLPNGYVPFEHIHLHQDEIFHVQKGEVRIVMDGKEFIAKEGETLTVPKGVAHIAYNNRDSVLDCIVEYRPGLDQAIFTACFVGLTNDGYFDQKGEVHIPKLGYFLTKMKAKCMTRPTQIPAVFFNAALKFFYVVGVFRGWSKLFEKYTGDKALK